MPNTPLLDAIRLHSGNEIPAADYRGATIASRFANPQQEFAALQAGCGVYDLGFRARISLTGGDRTRWLNGMVTNNIRDLAVGHGVYAFLLNPQGRILGDMRAFNRGNAIMVETDRSEVETILATFERYVIMDDVEVTEVSEQQTALGLAGPRARAVLNMAGIQVPNLRPLQLISPQCDCDCACLECTLIRGEDGPQESYEIWLAPKDVHKTWETLIAQGATRVGSEALEMQRIAEGIPLYGTDIREKDLPQETEQMRALNFNKGCYVGQEIVERIRSRGNVHRKFTGFVMEGAAGVEPGAKIVAAEKEVGEVTSVATLSAPSNSQTLALGYIRREAGIPGRNVSIGTARATVTELPFDAAACERSQSSFSQQR